MHAQEASGATGDIQVVGDHDDGLAGAVEVREEIDDAGAGGEVEVAGGLVGEEDGGVVGEGAGDGDALAFAAGELDGAVLEALAETDGAEEFFGPAAALLAADAGESECDLDVLAGGEQL